MMIVYPGDVRVFHLSRRSEVFVPASRSIAGRASSISSWISAIAMS
jgi:hypothetical protein